MTDDALSTVADGHRGFPHLVKDDLTRRRLTAFLRTALDNDSVALVDAERLEGGSSYETWRLDLSADRDDLTLVLRREPLVGPLAPYDVLREGRVIAAVGENSDVPVAGVRGGSGDPSIVGSPFTVLDYVAGDVYDYRSISRDERIDWAKAATRQAMAKEFTEVLSRVHASRWKGTSLGAVLEGPTEPATPLIKRIEGWHAAIVSRAGTDWSIPPIFHDAAEWLLANVPSTPIDELVCVHGDYKVGNFIWQGRDIAAVLDWEGACIGDRMEDLGYACHPFQRLEAPQLMAMLVPIDELCAYYEDATGHTVDRSRLHYYVIYAMYFHLYTLLSAMIAIPAGADFRIALVYHRLVRLPRLLAAQIAAFEGGQSVI